MSDYTPTTGQVRSAFANRAYTNAGVDEFLAQFDRWLAGVKADAWDEGRRFGYQDAQAHHGSGVEGAGCGPDSWDCTCQNPYRTTGIPTTEEAAND